MYSEKDIVSSIRLGSNEAMRDFYILYASYLSGVCSRYISNDEDAKDVFQDTIVKIIQHIADFKYRGEGSLKAWATKIAVNEALMFLKGSRKLETTLLDETKDNIADNEETPDTSGVTPEALHEMIRRLPDGYREVFNLYVIEGKSHKEIAQLLNIKEMTSASQLHRAKAFLAREINKYRKQA